MTQQELLEDMGNRVKEAKNKLAASRDAMGSKYGLEEAIVELQCSVGTLIEAFSVWISREVEK